MATLSVTVTHDYSANALNGIDLIDFDNPLLTLAVATFLVSQFDGTQIEFGAEIRDSAGKNGVVLIGQYVDANEFLSQIGALATASCCSERACPIISPDRRRMKPSMVVAETIH